MGDVRKLLFMFVTLLGLAVWLLSGAPPSAAVFQSPPYSPDMPAESFMTVYGWVQVQPRVGGSQYLWVREARVELWKVAPGGAHEYLGFEHTSVDAYYSFDPIPVVEGDGSSLFVRVLSVMDKDPMRPWQVSTVDPIVPGGIEYWTYGFDSEMQSDLASGIRMVFMSVDATHENVGALWLLDDIYRTKTFMEATNSGWEHTRFVHWQPGFDEMSPCTRSCFLPIVGPNGVFIAHSSIGSPDVVVHELGHSYLFRALGLDFYLNVPAYLRCLEHFTFAGTNDVCAWSEGWADFLPLLVNGDQCFDYDTPGPCTPPDPVSGNIRSDDLELQWLHDNRGDEGYHVEGRVAGALYDIADNGVDLLDDRSYGMGAISTVVLPPKVYTPDTARQFRNEWYYVWGDEKPISQIYLQNALIDRTYLPLQLKQ